MYPYDERIGQTFKPTDEEQTAQNYRLSQKQRELERKIRRAKKELKMLEDLDAPLDELARSRAKLHSRQDKLREFIEVTGRRHRPERVRTQ